MNSELDNNKINNKAKALTVKQIYLKATALSFVFVFILLLLTAGVFLLFANYKLNQVLSSAQVSRSEFFSTIKSGLNNSAIQDNGYKNFLVLGVDSVENRGDVPVLTDTIMLVSLDLNSASINTLSLPRDIYETEYQTKINALLYYGEERNPEDPTQFPTSVIETLTGVPIHHTVVLSLDSLQKLIDILGGVEIDIKEGFIDNQFPRSDVDIQVETDPNILYETVEFKAGTEVMTGERALKYIRSRHSSDDTGTDIARGQRQQQVLEAIINKLMNIKNMINNPKIVGQLYRYYLDNFAQYFPIEEGIAAVKQLYENKGSISFTSHSLSIYPDDEAGVLYNPPTWKSGEQWIYEILNLEKFKTEIKLKLNPRLSIN